MRGDTAPTWEGNMEGGYWSMMCRKDRTVRGCVSLVICIITISLLMILISIIGMIIISSLLSLYHYYIHIKPLLSTTYIARRMD